MAANSPREDFACVQAVARHWATLMTGGLVVALVGVGERVAGKDVPGWLYWALVIGFLFLAFFLAWRDQYRQVRKGEREIVELRQRLEADTPKLTGVIEQIATITHDNGVLQVFLQMLIRNRGAESVVDGWRVQLRTTAGSVLPAKLMALPLETKFKPSQSEQGITIRLSDAIFEKTARNPVRRRAAERGWLCALFSGDLTKTQLKQPGNAIEVTFRDCDGNEYKASHGFSGMERPTLDYYPGSGTLES